MIKPSRIVINGGHIADGEVDVGFVQQGIDWKHGKLSGIYVWNGFIVDVKRDVVRGGRRILYADYVRDAPHSYGSGHGLSKYRG